ncbi:MAG TPA: AEC family transporter [Cycloclasticus sp.]|jgi:predicted permease|nr:AEC family transporter [Cycloclasticus sp.]HIL91323.1 AEC family transporter [Cycloclasticus sp.]
MSEIINQINQALLPSAFIILMGVVLRHWQPAGLTLVETRRVISTLVLNLFYPALIFAVIPRVELTGDIFSSPLVSNIGIAVGMLACWIFYPWLKRQGLGKPELGALMLVCGLGNIISLGVPLLQSLQGEQAARYAIYIDIMAITPMLWIVGLWIAIEWGNNNEQRQTPVRFIKSLLSLPPIGAFALAILMNIYGISLPDFLQKGTTMLGNVTMSGMLLVVGMSLSFASLKKHKGIAVLASLIKLLIVPAVVYFTANITMSDAKTIQATVLLAATPSMMATMILSERYGLNTELLSTVLVTSTALFFVTLPVWLWVLA